MFFTFRASLKAFARAPALSLALLITIAIGVGSNAAIYGFIQGLLNPESRLNHEGTIVSILARDQAHNAGPPSRDEYQLLTHRGDVFEWVGAARIMPKEVTIANRTEIAVVAAMTSDLADTLKLTPGVGTIISHHMWQSEFHSNGSVIGRPIQFDGADHAITGVAPEHLEGLYSDQVVDLWTLLQDKDLQDGDRTTRDVWVFACLRRSVSIKQAQAIVRQTINNSNDLSVIPFTGVAPEMVRGVLRIRILLTFAAGAVFFIASINVASLLIGRAIKRSHETALRISFGATRRDLIGELLSDSIVVSLLGGVPGLLLAVCTAHAIPALLFQEDAERLVFAPHLLPTLSAAMVCMCLTMICGMMPVFATVTDRPWLVLGRESGMPSKRIERLRAGFIIGQIGACYVLVISSVFLMKGLDSALETSIGQNLHDPILLTVQTQSHSRVDVDYFTAVEKRAKSIPNLTPLAWTAHLPGSQPIWQSFRVQRLPSQFRDISLDIVRLTSESLNLIDSQPITGRMFGLRNPLRQEALVDENAASQLFGDETAGTLIQDPFGVPTEVIGVVKKRPANAPEQKHPTIYYDYTGNTSAPDPTVGAHFRVPVFLSQLHIQLDVNVVSPGYFNAFRMAFVAGQHLPEHPDASQGRVAVVNQQAADLYFGGNPLGAAILDGRGERTQIIGVVRPQTLGVFQQASEPTVYFPMQQDCPPLMTLILERSKANGQIFTELRRKMLSMPGYEMSPIVTNTLNAQLAQTAFAPLRIATLLSSVSAFTAVLLSILGLFNVQRDAQHQRQRELALRIALGAQRWRISLGVIQNAGKLCLLGILLGTSVSLIFLRILLSNTTAISTPPFRVWVIIALSTGISVLIASALPAVRAAVVDPLRIMRDDR